MLHDMLHGLPCLPRAHAAAPIAQPCLSATEPNFYRPDKYVPSRRSTHSSSRSSATTSSSASLPASEQKVNRRQGVRIALCNESMLLASVVDIGMPDTKMRPRGDRFYRPPAAAPLSLKPDGHFQPPRWLKLVSVLAGGHRLGLDVSSTGTACGVIVLCTL